FLLSETITDSAIDSIIFKLVRETPLQKRVVGQLEKTLHKRALERFQELVKNGEIVQFKLSKTKYKKSIYKTKYEFDLETKKGKFAEKDIELGKKEEPAKQLPEIPKQPQEIPTAKEILPAKPKEILPAKLEKIPENLEPKPLPQIPQKVEESDAKINSEGYQIIKTQSEAYQLNQDLREELKAGEIKGMKSFDGSYYVVKTSLLQTISEKMRNSFKKQKQQDLEELAKNCNVKTHLARVTCEFMKEDGEILEKKRNLFKYI
ncbi:MAG: hypothetical protein Q7K42_00680, partial [Candidatus Diapherotrites archaeon]|nr:hypothetical protein [Candidatus Diapherotrites archaeon]